MNPQALLSALRACTVVELLTARYGLSTVEAYILCSAAGDLKISVPKLSPTHASLVTFNMPKSIFVG